MPESQEAFVRLSQFHYPDNIVAKNVYERHCNALDAGHVFQYTFKSNYFKIWIIKYFFYVMLCPKPAVSDWHII